MSNPNDAKPNAATSDARRAAAERERPTDPAPARTAATPPAPAVRPGDEPKESAAEVTARLGAAAPKPPAEAAMAALQQVNHPLPGTLTGHEAARLANDGKGEETVDMIFPRSCMVQRDDRSKVHFPRGIHPVPRSLAEHPYLKQCGARPATASEVNKPKG